MKGYNHPKAWSLAEDIHVRTCADMQMSAGDISKSMKGRTKNAVIGYMHRNEIKLYFYKDENGRTVNRLPSTKRAKKSKRKVRK